MLAADDFLTAVRLTPLISIDLIVRSSDGKILMGKRVNSPAAGFWFVPGGRIYKSETLAEAFRRISQSELGTAYEISEAVLIGAFTHLYEDNFAHVPGIATHYVVLGYQLNIAPELEQMPIQQHDGYRWVGKCDDPTGIHPNSLTYFHHIA